MKIAITGNIACGKSMVSKYLMSKGYKIFDADKIGHELLEQEFIQNNISRCISREVLKNNKIDRQKLSEIVFNDNVKLKKLNSILHPYIRDIIKKNIQNEKIVFVEIALLYEANFVDLFDKVIVVTTDEENQLSRLMKRNQLSREDALKRINSQIPSKEKELLADYIIVNNSDENSIRYQVDKILMDIKGEIECY